MQTVAADDNFADLPRACFARYRIDEEGLDATVRLRDGRALPSDVQAVRPNALLECIEQDGLQIRAMNLKLRPFVSGVPPGRFDGRKDPAAQAKAIKPVGQWNAEEVTCKEGTIVVTINGLEFARGQGARPDHGPIGWQSEGAPIRFRKLTIRVLD